MKFRFGILSRLVRGIRPKRNPVPLGIFFCCVPCARSLDGARCQALDQKIIENSRDVPPIWTTDYDGCHCTLVQQGVLNVKV